MKIETLDRVELAPGIIPVRLGRPYAFFADFHGSDRSPGDPLAALVPGTAHTAEAYLFYALGTLPPEAVIYLVGDTWDETEIDGRGRGFGKIRQAYPLLVAELVRRRARYIIGNHDLWLEMDVHNLAYTEHILADPDTGAGGVVIQHGQDADPANKGRGRMGRIATRINGIVERLPIIRNLGLSLEPLAYCYKKKLALWRALARRRETAANVPEPAFTQDPYIEHGRRVLDERAGGRGLYVYGHTHRRGLVWADSQAYANVPAWPASRIFYVLVDSRPDMVALEIRRAA